jgi:RNA polymerase sigma factor
MKNDRAAIRQNGDTAREALPARVRLACEGNAAERERLIGEYRPYIIGIVRKMLGTQASALSGDSVLTRDEYSIGLIAFNEAIDQFRPVTGVPFLTFAGLVINRRLVDWFRREKRDRSVLRFSDLEEDEGTPMVERMAAPSGDLLAEMEAEEEILRLRNRLAAMGLSLFRLQRGFPRHQDSRQMCIRIARILREDETMLEALEKTRRLACADLARRSGTPLKTIEKNRGNIILLALMMDSGLEVIKGYLKQYGEASS